MTQAPEAGCPALGDLHYLKLNSDIVRDPYSFFARLRREAPVYREPDYGVYVVSRYDDVVEVDVQPEVFSSIAVASGPYRRLPPLDDLPRWRAERPWYDKVIVNDPPDHTRHRKILNRLFTPRRVAGLEPRVSQLVNEVIDGFISEGQVEFVSRYSNVLPPMVVGELLGVPHGDSLYLKDIFLRSRPQPGSGSLTPEELSEQFLERQARGVSEVRAAFIEYFSAAITQRRSAGDTSDIMGDLAHARFPDGEEVPFETIVTMILLLYQAGAEANTNEMLTNIAFMLASRPDVQAELRQDDSLVDAFVEEVLRIEPPLLGVFRVALQDAMVGGVPVEKGSIVLVLHGSANHDEERYSHPEKFDIHRSGEAANLTFGHGPHFCAGAALARLEGRVTTRQLLRRTANVRLGDGQPETPAYLPTILGRMPASLLIAFDPVGEMG